MRRSEAGSYLRLTDFVYHSILGVVYHLTLVLSVIRKEKIYIFSETQGM